MLKPNEVTTSKIATYAVTESKIAKDSVTNDKIKDGAVATSKIGEKQVTGEKIADRAVTTAKIVDGAVTGSKIADGAVTRDKISDGVLGRPLTPPVATTEIADASVTEAKLQNNSVSTDKVKDGAITGAKIAQNTITQGDIAANAVGTGELRDSAVTTPKILDGAVTPAKLSFTPGGVTRPLTPPIENAEIAGDAVTAEKIATGAVTNAKIADRAVDWVKIALACINHELLYNLAPPTDGQILSFDAATGKFNWIAPPTGGAGGMQLTLLPSQPLVFSENSMADIDQLIDLSTVIPVTAQAVLVEIQLNAMSVPVGMEQILTVLGRRSGSDYGNSTIHFIWQNMVGMNNNAYKECMLAVDALRQLRVLATKNGVFTSINIWIRGWIE
ncbi:MAG: hypothetical protein WC980_08655 [Candidatus Brocadiia bacterium]